METVIFKNILLLAQVHDNAVRYSKNHQDYRDHRAQLRAEQMEIDALAEQARLSLEKEEAERFERLRQAGQVGKPGSQRTIEDVFKMMEKERMKREITNWCTEYSSQFYARPSAYYRTAVRFPKHSTSALGLINSDSKK